MPARVIYLVRSWPRLSQTFVLEEVLALERRGLDLALFALVRSGETLVHPQVNDVRACVTYLDDAGDGHHRPRRALTHARVLARHPLRYARALLFCLRRRGLTAGYSSCSTLGGFDHAVRVSAQVAGMARAGHPATHLHAHFAHDPALVGLLAARITGLPFTFTAHARDLTQIPAASLRARAARAATLVTCCGANADYLRQVLPAACRPPVEVIRHGVRLDRFVPARREPGPVAELVSVGRLVPKKGYADLLRALALLRDQGVRFCCRIHGDGPLRADLERLRDDLGLRERVQLPGAATGGQVAAALAGADVFVLTPVHTDDGDRDGIPNVLVEAMACALPVATTSAGGVGELVHHLRNGLVAPPGDTTAIADCIGRLIADPRLRARLGDAARRTVESGHDVDEAARALDRLFRHEPAATPPPTVRAWR
jgi:glycosyltransferase involved in cell wall biosynthesis